MSNDRVTSFLVEIAEEAREELRDIKSASRIDESVLMQQKQTIEDLRRENAKRRTQLAEARECVAGLEEKLAGYEEQPAEAVLAEAQAEILRLENEARLRSDHVGRLQVVSEEQARIISELRAKLNGVERPVEQPSHLQGEDAFKEAPVGTMAGERHQLIEKRRESTSGDCGWHIVNEDRPYGPNQPFLVREVIRWGAGA